MAETNGGWPEVAGGPAWVYRPRTSTARAAVVVCAALLVASLVTGSRGAIFLAVVPFLFFVQCFQHVEVSGNRVRRTGLRAVDLDLSTARVVATGRPWWIQLFFLGRCLELRDADNHGLLLEAWLWSDATQRALVEAAAAANPSGATPHS